MDSQNAQPPADPTQPSAEDIARFQAHVGGHNQAAVEPFPGPLAEAFAGKPLEHAGFTFRKLVASDITLLKRLDSPMLRQMLEVKKPESERKPTAWTDEEGFEMVYQFTQPIAKVRAELNQSRALFKEKATQAVGDKISDPEDLKKLIELSVLNFFSSFATVIKYSGKQAGEGDGEVFPVPPAGPATGSAGGSTT